MLSGEATNTNFIVWFDPIRARIKFDQSNSERNKKNYFVDRHKMTTTKTTTTTNIYNNTTTNILQSQ